MSSILYIDDIVPDGWGEKYPVKGIYSLQDLREFSRGYALLKTSFEIGLDLREVDVRIMTPLLKLMEDSTLNLILRLREPVPETILSRAVKIHKLSRIDNKAAINVLIGDETIIGQKIRQLR